MKRLSLRYKNPISENNVKKKSIFVKMCNYLKNVFADEDIVITQSKRIIFDGNGGYRIGYI